jgi:chemotaxis protein methyltransferase CheR
VFPGAKSLMKKIGVVKRASRSRSWQSLIHRAVVARRRRTNAHTTAFLRCPNQYRVLTGPVLDFLRAHGTRSLQILVIGCSSGAEPYTAASELYRTHADLQVQVTGVDIEDWVLDIGRRGRYTRAQVYKNRLITPEFVDFTFDVLDGGEAFQVRPEIAERVRFVRANALDPALGEVVGPADIVFAQNFLYHLEPDAATAAFANVVRMLKPAGAVFLDGMDLSLKVRLTRRHGLHPFPDLVKEIHEDARAERGHAWPAEYWGLEPFSRAHVAWLRRYCTVFTTTPFEAGSVATSA